MRKIAKVDHTNDVPDEVLAQAVAGAAHWHRDEAGGIYDQDEVYVGSSLTEAAAAMRTLGWLVPQDAPVTGVAWERIDAGVKREYASHTGNGSGTKDWAELVRGAVRALRR